MTRSFYNTDTYAEHYLGIRWPRAIWQSVLQQAVEDLVCGPNEFDLRGLGVEDRRRLIMQVKDAARDWIDDNVNEPRRFVWVCELLGLDPVTVRFEVAKREASKRGA